MAEPPPPSYDDAIAGDYSSPPPHSSSPPPPPSSPPPPPSSSPPPASFPERPEPSLFIGETTRLSPELLEPQESDIIPSTPPRSSVFGDQSHMRPPSDHINRQNSVSVSSKYIKACIFIICVLVGVGILYFVLSPKEDISPSNPDDSNPDDCKNEPPRIYGGTWKFCPKNYNQDYSDGISCKFECNEDYVLYISNGLAKWRSIVYYTCERSSWVSSSAEYFKSLECLPGPSGPGDCKNKPPHISRGKYTYCPQNHRGEYTNGTKCSFKCNGEYVLNISTGDTPFDQSENSGSYTCIGAKWISSGGEINKNKKLRCLTFTEFIKQSIG